MGLVVAALTVVGALLLPPSGDPAAPPSTPPGGTATPPAPDAPAPSVRLGDAILGAGWEELEAGPVAGRHDPVAVWTGSRLFVWGGFEPASSAASAVSSWHRDGALYDPIAGLWSPWE